MKMKLVLLTVVIITLLLKGVNGQEWDTAPEIWSEPILYDSVFNKPYHWIKEYPPVNKVSSKLRQQMLDKWGHLFS